MTDDGSNVEFFFSGVDDCIAAGSVNAVNDANRKMVETNDQILLDGFFGSSAIGENNGLVFSFPSLSSNKVVRFLTTLGV